MKCPCGKPVVGIQKEVIADGKDAGGWDKWRPGPRIRLTHESLPYIPFCGPPNFDFLAERFPKCVVSKDEIRPKA